MIFDALDNAAQVILLPQPLQAVLSYLQATDFTTVAPGVHDLNNGVRVIVQASTPTKPAEEVPWEVHRDHIDVQYVWRGTERIMVAHDSGTYPIKMDFLPGHDVRFYENVMPESHVDLSSGRYAIFFPADIHRPGCQVVEGQKGESCKVVLKVPCALLSAG